MCQNVPEESQKNACIQKNVPEECEKSSMPEWLSASDAPRRMDGDVCDSGGWWRRHQALACFGSRVTAVLRGHAILPNIYMIYAIL